MRRREFIAGLMLAPTMRAAVAQQPAKMKRIAMVNPSRKVDELTINGAPHYKAFFEELGRLGYVEGQNLAVERYSGEGRIERYSELAREVVGSHPDLIFAMSGAIALPLKLAATTVPIVTITADPIALGLVPSIAHPGGNITGVTVDAGLEIYGKRFGLLVEAVPKTSNVRYLASKARMGATHFLTKTLPKVAAEMALSVLAYNLTRVINIVGSKPLMAAIVA